MSGERVVVIEDETDLLEILEFHLEREGFEVLTYSRGDSAWAGRAVRFDREGHQVFFEDEEVRPSPTEFRLVSVLLERRGQAQTRNSLLADVWGYSDGVDSRTVDTHIRRLRRKLDPPSGGDRNSDGSWVQDPSWGCST